MQKFDVEQKGCKRGCYGKNIPPTIKQGCTRKLQEEKNKLSTAWIDYKNTFDSDPHSWMIK